MTVGSPSPRIEVRRSRRRTRTISARREHDAIVVMIPAGFSAAEEAEWVEKMVDRLVRSERRRGGSDTDLMARAAALSARYLDGRASPVSVRWVTNQNTRWGSCTPSDKTIRLSHRIRSMPAYVVDYVLLHELTHLLVHGHGERFWEWVARYPQSERARGYLEGVSDAAHLGLSPDCADDASETGLAAPDGGSSSSNS